MAWRNAISSPGLEYSFNCTACFSKACLIPMTSSRRKEKHEGKFRSGPSTYRMAPAAATLLMVACFRPNVRIGQDFVCLDRQRNDRMSRVLVRLLSAQV